MDPLTPQAAVMAVGCLIAIYTDVRWGKIYNWTTMPMMALGLAMNVTVGAWWVGVMGFAVAFVIHYALFRAGIQKGGDTKLMMGIGALLGAHFALEASIWYAVFYVPAGLAVLTLKGRLGNLFKVVQYESARKSGAEGEELERPEETLLRTAPVIAFAAFAAFTTPWLHFLLFASGGSGPLSTGG
ncbi:MAG: A24 family peptidase [Myxococcota bacterium]